ncbi:hypothetical protein SAMN05421858_4153 [Haladaptatus litoreus]|uniref:Uncharacterized protein n=1 Tax=Haladaptatus litoreus TaxID=553468 RepID=A0A1N7EA25_9EURY|nr:hypothetical protein [Haladaptatus litoreus]SIR84904.1 hypothetical protein SAMN05421858_4153 [Haladaptatus litoreus]
MRMGKSKMREAGESEAERATETKEAGIRMVALWILLTIALFVLGRRARRRGE